MWIIVTVGPPIAFALWHGYLERIRGGRLEISAAGSLVRAETDLGTIVIASEWVEFVASKRPPERFEIKGGQLLIDYQETRRWAIFQESLNGLSALDTARVFRDAMIEGQLMLVTANRKVPFFTAAQYRPKDALLEPYYGFLRQNAPSLYGFRDVHEIVASKVHALSLACQEIGVEVQIVPDVPAS